mgnify:CR=1 FL=1
MKIPSSIRRAARAPAPPPRIVATPAPRRTKARPDGSTRRQVRPKPVRTEFGSRVVAALFLLGKNRSDLAERLGCTHQRVHQVLCDRRMDAPAGADATMDGWRERIRAALAGAPSASAPPDGDGKEEQNG